MSYRIVNQSIENKRIEITSTGNSEFQSLLVEDGLNPTHVTTPTSTAFCLGGVELVLSDHVYLALPITQGDVTFNITTNGVTTPVIMLARQVYINGEWIYQGTDDDNLPNFGNWIRDAGIAMIETDDRFGCNPLYRLQNMTDGEMSVTVSAMGMRDGNGIEPYIRRYDNDSISVGEPNDSGYKNLSFKLSPNTSGLPELIHKAYPASVFFWLMDGEDATEPYQYQIWIDDVALINPYNGTDVFRARSDSNLPSADTRVALREALSSATEDTPSPIYANYGSINFGTNEHDRVRVFRIRQTALGNVDRGRFTIANPFDEYMISGYRVVSDTPTVQEIEFMTYDPIDIRVYN